MPQLLPYIVYGVLYYGAEVAVGYAFAAYFATSLIVNDYEQRMARSAARDAYNASLRDREIMTATTNAPRSIVYGRARNVDGVLFKATHGTNKEFFTLVIALAGREVDSIETVYFNDLPLALDGSGYVIANPADSRPNPYIKSDQVSGYGTIVQSNGGGSVSLPNTPTGGSVSVSITVGEGATNWNTYTVTPTVVGNVVSFTGQQSYFDGMSWSVQYQYSQSTPYARIRKYVGTATQDLSPDLAALVPSLITSGRQKFNGIACLIVTLTYNRDAFPGGLPQISAVCKGSKVYDPRLDSTYPGGSGSHRPNTPSTWAWSENPALCALDWARYQYGGGLSISECVLSTFVAAANASDVLTNFKTTTADTRDSPTFITINEKRYLCAMVCNTGAAADAPFNDIIASMAGSYGWSGGLLRVRAGAWRASVATLTEDWVSDNGSIDIQAETAPQDTYNIIRPSIADAAQGYAITPTPPVRSDPYIAADGQEMILEMQLPAVSLAHHALDICKVKLLEGRESLICSIPCKMHAFQTELFDVLTVQLPQYGWTVGLAKTFEVQGWTFSMASGVKLVLREVNSTIYDPDTQFTLNDLANNTALPSPWVVTTPVGLAVANGTADGETVRVVVSWTLSTDAAVLQSGTIEVTWATPSDYSNGKWSSLQVPGKESSVTLTNLVPNTYYTFRIRAVNSLQVASAWATQKYLLTALVRQGGGNFVPNSRMFVDSNSDGVPDGWLGYANGTATSQVFTMFASGGPGNDGYAKAAATLGNTTNDRIGWSKTPVAFPVVLPAAGGYLTISAFVKSVLARPAFYCEFWSVTPTILDSIYVSFPPSADWTRISGMKFAPAGTVQARIYIWGEKGNGASSISCTNVQVEAGERLTAYKPKTDEVLAYSLTELSFGGANLISNASFEQDSNANGMSDFWGHFVGYTGDGTRVHTLSRPTAQRTHGLCCQEVLIASGVSTGSDSGLVTAAVFKVEPSTVYTLSLDIWTNVASKVYGLLRCFNSGGAGVGDNVTSVVAPTGQWVRKVVTFTTPATAVSAEVQVRGITLATEYFRVDSVQVQLGNVATQFAPRTDELLPSQFGSISFGGSNVVLNSGFELDTNVDGLSDSWVSYGSGSYGSKSHSRTADGIGLSWAQRAAATSLGTSEANQVGIQTASKINITGLEGTAVTVSAYVAASANLAIYLILDFYTSGDVAAGTVSTRFDNTTSVPTRRVVGTFVVPANAAKVLLTVCMAALSGRTPAAATLHVDNVQLEPGDILTAYAPRTDEVLSLGWDVVTGTNRPADYATSDLTLLNLQNTSIQGNTVTMISGGGSWANNGNFYSRESYTSGAFVSFSPTSTGQAYMIGLDQAPTEAATYGSIDYCIYCTTSAKLEVYESNVGYFGGGTGPTYAAGDVLTVQYDGQFVRYLINGTVFRTIAAPVGMRLYVDSAMDTLGSKVTNIRFGPLSNTSQARGANLVDSSWWTPAVGDPTTSTPISWTGSKGTGTGGADAIVFDTLADGSGQMVWKATQPSDTGGAGGGWNPSAHPTNRFDIDPKKTYMFACYFKRVSGTGYGYWGPDQNSFVCVINTTTPDTGNYFVYSADLVNGKWYLAVGWIYPYGSTGNSSGPAGFYDCQTGAKLANGLSFNWNAVTNFSTRAYQYYGSAGAVMHFASPQAYVCDGSEPNLSDLLSMGGVSARNQLSASNIAAYMADLALQTRQLAYEAATKVSFDSLATITFDNRDDSNTSISFLYAALTNTTSETLTVQLTVSMTFDFYQGIANNNVYKMYGGVWKINNVSNTDWYSVPLHSREVISTDPRYLTITKTRQLTISPGDTIDYCAGFFCSFWGDYFMTIKDASLRVEMIKR